MFKLILKFSAGTIVGAGGAASSAVVLDRYDVVDLTEYPFIRAARTGLTTMAILADYKMSLSDLKPETTEYEAAKSEVSRSYSFLLFVNGCVFKCSMSVWLCPGALLLSTLLLINFK